MLINLETVKFINDLNQLAEQSQYGILPLSTFNDWEERRNYLFYDSRNFQEKPPCVELTKRITRKREFYKMETKKISKILPEGQHFTNS